MTTENRTSAYRDATPVSGYEVYRSPEFRALCERFGVAWGLLMGTITLTINEEKFTVTHEYSPRVGTRSPYIDTTTLHNETYRTSMPRPDYEVRGAD